jgi:hypothetical protein
MAMIKCGECGRDISDKAPACVGCGAPVVAGSSTKVVGDVDGDGKVGMSDVKAAFGVLGSKAADLAQEAAKQGKEMLKSQSQKDAEAVKAMSQGFGDAKPTLSSESDRNCSAFKAALESTIDAKYAEIMRGKTDTDRYLTYIDGQILTASVRNVFKGTLRVTPPQVEAACNLSDAILAPSNEERQRLLKTAVGAGGGAAGIGMVIAGVGSALGWGASVFAGVSAFFTGAAVAGPIGWMVGGVTLAAIAAYFATTSDKHKDTDRFLKVLKSSSARAVDAIWPEHGDSLFDVVKREPSA